MSVEETIEVSDVIVEDRIRSTVSDIKSLAASIKEFGVIQPIVLNRTENCRVRLVAGGRRLAALKELGVQTLVHGKDFVWRGEESDYQRKAVELEENLRRSDLTWPEVCLAKKQLLKLMEGIHGVSKDGRPRRVDILSGDRGFGVRSLATMLGESPGATSKDLQVADMLEQFPALKTLPTKQDALRRLNVAITVGTMQAIAQASAAKHQAEGKERPKNYVVYEGDYLINSSLLPDGSVDLVVTDLPYACGLGDSTAAHGAGLAGFVDSNLDIRAMCSSIAGESARVLANNRFAVFFFGFAYYQELKDALELAGFTIDPYPFIWKRDRTAPPNAFARYAKCYDPALVCSKGNPTFIRSGSANFIDVPSVRGTDRLHAAQKPVLVIERFILDMTAEGATVVDWMAGSGTTGEAALKNKRRAILFEKEAVNCKMIEARLGAMK